MKMLRSALAAVSAGALMLMASAAFAGTISITPTTDGVIGANLGPANCEAGCVYDAFGLDTDPALVLLYKSDVVGEEEPFGTSDSGLFALSYSTEFGGDPNSATITWVGPETMSCPECYMAIKDGNANPSYYFFSLNNWNGTDTLSLSGFWAGTQGAISHVSIWGRGGEVTVPEPGTLALLGLGLLGLGIARRRKSA